MFACWIRFCSKCLIFSILMFSAITTSYHYIYYIEYVFFYGCFKFESESQKEWIHCPSLVCLAATFNLCVSSPVSTRCHFVLFPFIPISLPTSVFSVYFVGHNGGSVPTVYGMSSHLITFCSVCRSIYSTNLHPPFCI